jgi:protein AroM
MMHGIVHRIGALTIGQSPRPDLTCEIQHALGEWARLVEAGALDGLPASEVAGLYPRAGETLLVTRLADGSEAQVAEERIIPLMQGQLDHLDEKGCAATLLLCTGSFESLHSRGLLIRMDSLLLGTVRATAEGKRLGVLCPETSQFGWMRERWGKVSSQVELAALPPLSKEADWAEAGCGMRSRDVELIVMDCMGYSAQMQELVFQTSGLPVLRARSLAMRILQELYSFEPDH